MIFGFIFVIAGAVFLLKNLGYITEDAWDIIWPVILIVIGLAAIFKRRERGFFWEERFGWGKKEIREKEE